MYASTKLRKIREICINNGHTIDKCQKHADIIQVKIL